MKVHQITCPFCKIGSSSRSGCKSSGCCTARQNSRWRISSAPSVGFALSAIMLQSTEKLASTLMHLVQIQKRKHPEADADGIVRRTSQGWRQGSTAVGSPSGRGTRNSETMDFMHNSSSSPGDSEERALSPGRSPLKGGRGQNPGKPSQPTRPTPRHLPRPPCQPGL